MNIHKWFTIFSYTVGLGISLSVITHLICVAFGFWSFDSAFTGIGLQTIIAVPAAAIGSLLVQLMNREKQIGGKKD